jgi:type II secretory pathway pseudopilin PulG
VKKLNDERGSSLMMAIIILFVILGMGTALVATAVGQKHTASNQQNSESAYALAEAALNAQIYALSVQWPTNNDYNATASGNSPLNNYGYPYSCNAASNGSTYCPTPNDLASPYPATSSTLCPAGTPGDAWSKTQTTPDTTQWTTYVRDAGTAGSTQQEVFSDAAEETDPYYNSSYSTLKNGSNYVWIRSVATVNCKTVILIDQVAMQTSTLTFPNYVVNANSINAGNNGNKIILNLQDPTTGASVDVSLRCTGLGGIGTPPDTCDGLTSSQVAPSTMSSNYFGSATSGTTLSASQLSAVETLAKQDGGYYPPGTCPTEAQLTNTVVYIDGNATNPAACSYSAGNTINSPSNPGLLVIPYGTFALTGGEIFYGLIYDANEQGASGTTDVVTLSGNSTIYGGIDVDGNGGVSLGDSGNGTTCLDPDKSNQKCGDLEYLANAFNGLVGFGGADATPNSFRQLPAGS